MEGTLVQSSITDMAVILGADCSSFEVGLFRSFGCTSVFIWLVAIDFVFTLVYITGSSGLKTLKALNVEVVCY
jgi:hypothetical protein